MAISEATEPGTHSMVALNRPALASINNGSRLDLTHILILVSVEKYAFANCSPSLFHCYLTFLKVCLGRSLYLRVDSMILITSIIRQQDIYTLGSLLEVANIAEKVTDVRIRILRVNSSSRHV
jgi:hypothetical protein